MSGGSLKSGSWVLLDNLSAAGISFLFFVVTARILSPLEFGVAAITISIGQIISPMVDSLFHDAIIQREDLDTRDVQTAFTVVLGWSCFLAVALVLSSGAIASFSNAPTLAAYLPWMAISVVFSGLMAVPSALARRNLAFRGLAIRTVLSRTIATAAGLTLAFMGAGTWAVVVQTVLTTVLSATLLFLYMRPSLHLMVDMPKLKRMLGFAGPAMGTQLLLFSSSRVFTLINSALMGPTAAATWNVALRFVEPLQMVAATTIGQFTLPLYARRQSSRDDMSVAFLLGSRRTSMVLMPMFIGLGVCAPQIISIFVGDRWLAAAPMMSIICLVFAVVASRQLVEICLTAMGAPQLNFLIQAVGVVCSLGGLAIGAPYGLLASTAGWGLRTLPFIFLATPLLKLRVGVSAGRQIGAIAPAFIASGVMAAAVLGFQIVVSARLNTLTVLLASVALGFLVYVATALLISKKAREDIRLIVENLQPSL